MFSQLVDLVSRICERWKTSIEQTIRLGRVNNSAPADISNPLLPTSLVQWYYNTGSATLQSLNPLLSPANVNTTCSGQFECTHDFILRINPTTSQATSNSLDSFRDSRVALSTHSSARAFFLTRVGPFLFFVQRK